MLDKKQIQATFLFEFKMGRKAALTTCNINSVFGPGTANEHTVQWRSKKFCKENKGLEDEEYSTRPSEVDNDQLRRSSKLILFQLHKWKWKWSRLVRSNSFNPMDCSLPDFSVHRIFQARILEQEVARELNVNYPIVIQHLKQIGKMKKLNKWVPRELTKNFKKSSFWSVVFS